MAPMISRDELRSYLGKPAWPIAPAMLVDFARDRGAPADVVRILERLPNRMYMSEGDLWSEFQALLQVTRGS